MGPIIGFCMGVFDCFHFGHLKLIERAANQVDHLIVGVVKDAAVTKQKGDTRPIIPFEQRIAIVSALKYTGEAVALEEFDPYPAVMDAIKLHDKVDKYFRGADQDHIPLDRIEKLDRIEIIRLDRTPDISTSQLVNKMNGWVS